MGIKCATITPDEQRMDGEDNVDITIPLNSPRRVLSCCLRRLAVSCVAGRKLPSRLERRTHIGSFSARRGGDFVVIGPPH